jgi:hypothetical protein
MLKHSLGNITPAKMLETQPEVTSVQPKGSKEELHHKTLGIYAKKTAEGTRYILVEIGFNPETGETSGVKELVSDFKEETIDKFKFRVDELGFFSGQLKGE